MDRIVICPLPYIEGRLGSLSWERCAGGLREIYFVVAQLWPSRVGVMVPEPAIHTASAISGDFGC
jgi:hypothetical protein